jgi:carboxypeptidase Taq
MFLAAFLSFSSRTTTTTSFLVKSSVRSSVGRPRSYVTTIPRGGSTGTAIPAGAASITEEHAPGAVHLNEDEGATSSTAPAPPDAYQQLVSKLETITQLGRASAVLSYDQLVFMPSGAASERGAQLAALATVIHEKKTDPALLTLMDEASAMLDANDGRADDDARRWLALERKALVENQRIPTELAARAASLGASAYSDWVAAKGARDFAAFAPTLQQCFDTAMALAKAKMGDSVGDDHHDPSRLYGQMLDEFEVGMSQGRIDTIFGGVQGALVPLIAQVLKSTKAPSGRPLEGMFDVDRQRALSEKLVTAIGFSRDRGRIDVSVHPFSMSISAADVRITSRFRQDEWCQGLAGTLHEGGHAIYEQNLGPSPSGLSSLETALSMGTHESQSLFWERHIGLSRPFWRFARPHLVEALESLDAYSAEEIYGAVNRVSQSLIRVEADELTYPLHVILRYTIEKEVVAGQLKVEDINQRWNALMKELLNVDVPSDDRGALQDVHWSGLAIGYFPTYLIGAIAAAQLYHYCAQDIPDLESKIESGDFAPIKDWLKIKVHQHGRRYPSLDAMLEDQLGERLNAKYFIDYLTNKYRDLYGIP